MFRALKSTISLAQANSLDVQDADVVVRLHLRRPFYVYSLRDAEGQDRNLALECGELPTVDANFDATQL